MDISTLDIQKQELQKQIDDHHAQIKTIWGNIEKLQKQIDRIEYTKREHQRIEAEKINAEKKRLQEIRDVEIKAKYTDFMLGRMYQLVSDKTKKVSWTPDRRYRINEYMKDMGWEE